MVRHISLAGLLVILLVGVVGCSQGTSKETIALREEVDVLKKEVSELRKITDRHQNVILSQEETVVGLVKGHLSQAQALIDLAKGHVSQKDQIIKLAIILEDHSEDSHPHSDTLSQSPSILE